MEKIIEQLKREGGTIMKNNKVKYRWREPYANVWRETRCEVLEYNDKTAKIKLLEFGKNQRQPGSIMRVHLSSLVGFELPKPVDEEPDWHKYTYFD